MTTKTGRMKYQKNIPFMATGLVIFVNDKRGAVAGAIWKDNECVRCAPILKRLLIPYGPQSTHQINFNYIARMGWRFFYFPDEQNPQPLP